MTRSPSTCASAFRISSAMPSERYSWSRAGLMSANGSTAMDVALAREPASGEGGTARRRPEGRPARSARPGGPRRARPRPRAPPRSTGGPRAPPGRPAAAQRRDREHPRDQLAEVRELRDLEARGAASARRSRGGPVALERQAPRQHLEQHHPEREHVGPLVLRRAAGLLRRHVRRGAAVQAAVPERVREAEVEDLDPTVLAQEHVLRLQIPVDDAARVRVRHPLRDLHRHPQGLARPERSSGQPRRQRLAAEELQHQVRARLRRGPRRRASPGSGARGLAAVSASRRTRPSSCPTSAPGRTALNATRRPRSRSRASQTSPKPPRPSSRISSKRPMIAPGRSEASQDAPSGTRAISASSAVSAPGLGPEAAGPPSPALPRTRSSRSSPRERSQTPERFATPQKRPKNGAAQGRSLAGRARGPARSPHRAYGASPFPNDQLSLVTSTRLTMTSSRRTPTSAWRSSARRR